MSGFSNYVEIALINHILRGIPFAAPRVEALHVALFTSDPTDANSAAAEHPTGTWYARQPVGAWAPPQPVGETHETFNLASVNFPVVTGSTVTITHAAIMDAPLGGNMLLSSALKRPKTIEADDVLTFGVGALRFNID